MYQKKILSVTAFLTFGYVALITNDDRLKRYIAICVMLNGFLCHSKNCVKWDVFCNTIIVIVANCTCKDQPTMLCGTSIGVVIWLLNHYILDSVLLHAMCVQLSGAILLLNWRY